MSQIPSDYQAIYWVKQPHVKLTNQNNYSLNVKS
jgi:hypothetical protein